MLLDIVLNPSVYRSSTMNPASKGGWVGDSLSAVGNSPFNV